MNYSLALTFVAAAVLGSTAGADRVSTAVRAETDQLARQYAGRRCTRDYDLDIDHHHRTLSAAQIRAKRIAIYNDWKDDLEEDAREDGKTYRLGYTNDRVWYWQKDTKGKTKFKVVTISATTERELSCKL